MQVLSILLLQVLRKATAKDDTMQFMIQRIEKGDWERIRDAAEKQIQDGDLMPGHFYKITFDFELDAKLEEIVYKLERIELIETDDDELPF